MKSVNIDPKAVVKLTTFAKCVSDKLAVDVGIMGGKNNRKDGGVSNADVGFVHEFGTAKIPKRSFLRMPLFLKSDEIMESVKGAGYLKKLGAGNMRAVLSDLGIACEGAIGEAFDSAGFGSWPPNAYSTILRKAKGSLMVRRQKAAEDMFEGGSHTSPLIATGQLRRSITSKVVKV